jgi:hypothetical protein
MRLRGCIIASVVISLTLICGFVAICLVVQNWYNPSCYGRRVNDWADIAMGDSDPANREAATKVLVEAFQNMRGEPRITLTQRFCGSAPRVDDRGEPVLPKELLPFLLETLHAKEMHPDSYPAWAISRVEPDAAIPALVDVVLHDEDEDAYKGALSALGKMGRKAVPVLHQLLTEVSEARRELVSSSLKRAERDD